MYRSLFRTSMLSKPALSARQRGMTSRALAYRFIMIWDLPLIVRAWSRRYLPRGRGWVWVRVWVRVWVWVCAGRCSTYPGGGGMGAYP